MPVIPGDPTPTSYATVADLQARFRAPLDTVRAQAALDDGAAIIDEYVGSSLWEVAGAVDRLKPYGGKQLYLGLPTFAVTSVTVEGEGAGPPYTAIPGASWTLHPYPERNVLERVDGSYWPGGSGSTIYYPAGGSAVMSPMGNIVPGAWAGIVVTRTRGFNVGNMPRALKMVNVSIAQRLFIPFAVVGETIGDYAIKYDKGDIGEHQLTQDEEDVLVRWSATAGEVTGK